MEGVRYGVLGSGSAVQPSIGDRAMTEDGESVCLCMHLPGSGSLHSPLLLTAHKGRVKKIYFLIATYRKSSPSVVYWKSQIKEIV